MTYKHSYWALWLSSEWTSAWPTLVSDTQIIFEAADVCICGPGAGGNLSPPTADEEHGIIFNGVDKEHQDAFRLQKAAEWRSVDTARKPYNIIVACLLLRAHMLAPSQFFVHSEGEWHDGEWIQARRLYSSLWPDHRLQCPWNDAETVSEAEDSAANNTVTIIDTPPAPSAQTNPPEDIQPGFPLLITLSTLAGIDFAPVRDWLAYCEGDSNHAGCKGLPCQWVAIPGTTFKLIDLEERCIVVAPDKCDYLVLGCVPKGSDSLRLTRETRRTLARPGGLTASWPEISKTVQDAILVCKVLGERFLWVDCLCIMQDDSRDQKFQNLRLPQIYAQAKCLLAPVSAETTDDRLLQDTSSVVNTEGSLQALLTSSPWMRRAWSYQEMVLSHRALLFTSAGVFVQCQKGIYSATGARITAEDDRGLGVKTVGKMFGYLENKRLGLYLAAVEEYSGREFLTEEDRSDAFQAIFRAYRGFDGKDPLLADAAAPSRSPESGLSQLVLAGLAGPGLFQSRPVSIPNLPHDGVSHPEEPSPYPRKPIYQNHPKTFGFPTSISGKLTHRPGLSLYASLVKLHIGSIWIRSDGTNGLYSVFALGGALGWAPHLGSIWLDKEWRLKDRDDGALAFMALHGGRQSFSQSRFTITLLMLIERRMEGDQCLGWERVQLMDCSIHEDDWVRLGGENVSIELYTIASQYSDSSPTNLLWETTTSTPYQTQ
ncbi:uncharacterized protein BO80DRAFT_472073 [Aspergillus ibericus CBS 121593]|uniref:Heterokaryon incompatibility domain-containing protein n=1 Tax=Aspergillus ibericus CBS 121593 TaxID=1448316 RepID=A0A395H496_9EURO|nr:hypothetical protein BO80DRAFT_472073 [Aspergillus ibericus CBS 121593]RAL02647.1 hypothetical protein BO80DRAFT_472073 [Aspergillus ibericus CBS 121593]